MTDEVPASVKEAVQASIKESGFQVDGDKDLRDAAVETDSTSETSTETVETKEELPATGEEPVVETKKEEKVSPVAEKKDKEKVPPVSKVEEDGDFRPSAEELEAIDKNPELKKVYRSMVKGFTAKTTELAEKRKEAEAAMNAVNAIKENPVAAIRAMAAAANIKLAEEPAPTAPTTTTEKTVIQKLQESLEAKIGKEAADVLAPVLLEAVGVITGEELGPVKLAIEQQRKVAEAQSLRTSISEFGSSVVEDGGEWDEDVEREMATLVNKVVPREGVTLPEYLEVLYNNVQTIRNKMKTTEREVTRIKTAAQRAEPVRAVRTTAPAPRQITPGMDLKEATALAVAAARAEAASR